MARPPTPKSPATAADPRSTRRHDPPRWGRAGPTGTCTPKPQKEIWGHKQLHSRVGLFDGFWVSFMYNRPLIAEKRMFVCKETYFPVQNWDLDFMPLTCGRDRGFEFCWYIPEIFSGTAVRPVRHNSCLGEIKFSPSGLYSAFPQTWLSGIRNQNPISISRAQS